jgi:hypothetical protein
MVINLDSELEAALAERAMREGVSPQDLALRILREQVRPRTELPEPRDEWERRLLAIATDCGVSLTNEQLSRETMYD